MDIIRRHVGGILNMNKEWVKCGNLSILLPRLFADWRIFRHTRLRRNSAAIGIPPTWRRLSLQTKWRHVTPCVAAQIISTRTTWRLTDWSLTTLCSTSFHSRYFSLIYMYYCVIVAFCQHVLNEHAMLCYAMLSAQWGYIVPSERQKLQFSLCFEKNGSTLGVLYISYSVMDDQRHK